MFSTFTNLSNIKKFVVNASSSLTQSDTVQNVKEKVVSIPSQTKEYFYPSPEQHEMRSVVRLDHAFFVDKDIEDYITPGQQSQSQQQQQQQRHEQHSNLTENVNNTPVKPSGNASSITSWHDFELCVEDEALFDETEIGSYTTTNYSVTTAATSVLSPHYNINGHINGHSKKTIHFRQSTLNKHNADNKPLKIDEETETQSDLNLNLDEDNPEKLFQNLHKFRKSFIAKRKASGAHDLDEQTAFSAPPTSKSDGSYHRRLHTLDLDEMDAKLNPNSDDDEDASDNTMDDMDDMNDMESIPINKREEEEASTPIAQPNNANIAEKEDIIHHAIEGSRELGIDDIGIINNMTDSEESKSNEQQQQHQHHNHHHNHHKKEEQEQKATNLDEKKLIEHGRSGSIKWVMSRDRESSKIFASGDILNGSDDDNECNDDDKNTISNISLSKTNVNNRNNEHVDFDLDIDIGDDEMDDYKDDMDESAFIKLKNHFSVERKLNGPRGSMKVTQISVSDELRETLIHQKSISQGNNDNPNMNVNINEPSPPTSQSSFDKDHQSELGDYVKRVSVTPRGVDPDNATVSVIDSIKYKDREYLKSKSQQHQRSDSMNTQPDNNDKAPYINQQQLNVLIQEEVNKSFQFDQHTDDEHDDDDGDDQEPPDLGSRQESVLIRQESAQFYDHGLDEIGVDFSDNNNDKTNDDKDNNESNEGWEQPTGYDVDDGDNDDNDDNDNNDDIDNNKNNNSLLKTPRTYDDNDSNPSANIDNDEDEKYECYDDEEDEYDDDDDDDGYRETTRGGPSMMTMGGNYLNVLRFIPWNENEYLPQELDESYDERIIPRFGIAESLNQIIRFHWNGDALLKCDVIVIPITEDWTPISQISHQLMNNAGSEYLEYIYNEKKMGEYVSTGDAQCCDSYNLPSQYIIHTSPPKYDDRYPVASENAMNSCYWRSLEIGCDLNCKTIVFPSIHPPKLFSEQLAIHILSRTLRRFLERYENVSFESIVICVESEEQLQLYTRIFTIYFPRDNIDLKYSQKYMPAYTGNDSGGTVVKLRKQKIELSPLINRDEMVINDNTANINDSNIHLINRNRIDYETYDIYGNLRPAIQCMVEYKEEPEVLWKEEENKKWSWQKMEESFNIKYKRYWNRCRKLNLHHIALYQFVYVGGQDREGRDIIIFVGNRFPSKKLMQQKKLKQSLLYIIRELHHIVDRDYIIIYLHSFVNEENNLPPISWINQCFQICSNRFHKNLHKFYVIHPNFRLKSWFYVLSTKLFYQKIIYLDSMTKLEAHNIDLEHIALPGKSWEYERELFGEDKLVDKMALPSDDLVLDALPYR